MEKRLFPKRGDIPGLIAMILPEIKAGHFSQITAKAIQIFFIETENESIKKDLNRIYILMKRTFNKKIGGDRNADLCFIESSLENIQLRIKAA